MANAVIGALRVDLGMNSAKFSDGVKRANKGLAKFGQQIRRVGMAVAAATAGMVAAFGATFTKISGEMDRIAKTSQKIGVPVEELSALRHAAELTGTSVEGMRTALGRFSQNVADAMAGVKTEGSRALAAFQVQLKNSDGSLKSTTELLSALADRFRAMEDGPIKTALAMRIFGRAGQDLIPLLNAGSAGIKQMTDEARRLGLVFSTEAGQAAERFNDNLTRIKAAFQGVATQLTAHMLPAMEYLSQRLVDAMMNGGALDKIINALTTAFNVFARSVVFVVEHMDTLVALVKVFVAATLVQFVANAALAFVAFARSIRAAGLAMGAFVAIKNVGMRGILLMAGVIAIAFDQFKNLEKGINDVWNAIKGFFPNVSKEIETFFGDIDALDAQMTQTFNGLTRGATKAAATLPSLDVASRMAASGVKKLTTETEQAGESLNQSLASTLGGGVANAFQSVIDGSKSVKAAVADMAKSVANNLIRSGLNSIIGSLFGTGSSGAFAGFFANGGNIARGQWGIAGENGPEVVTGPASVYPSGAMPAGGGGVNVVVNADFRGADASAVAGITAKITELESNLERRVKGILANERRYNPASA